MGFHGGIYAGCPWGVRPWGGRETTPHRDHPWTPTIEYMDNMVCEVGGDQRARLYQWSGEVVVMYMMLWSDDCRGRRIHFHSMLRLPSNGTYN